MRQVLGLEFWEYCSLIPGQLKHVAVETIHVKSPLPASLVGSKLKFPVMGGRYNFCQFPLPDTTPNLALMTFLKSSVAQEHHVKKINDLQWEGKRADSSVLLAGRSASPEQKTQSGSKPLCPVPVFRVYLKFILFIWLIYSSSFSLRPKAGCRVTKNVAVEHPVNNARGLGIQKSI